MALSACSNRAGLRAAARTASRSVLAPLALTNVDHPSLGVDIGSGQGYHLGDAQTGSLDGDENGAHPQIGDGA